MFKSPLGGVKSHPERDDKVFTHKKVPLTGHDSSYGATAASGGRDWVPFFVLFSFSLKVGHFVDEKVRAHCLPRDRKRFLSLV